MIWSENWHHSNSFVTNKRIVRMRTNNNVGIQKRLKSPQPLHHRVISNFWGLISLPGARIAPRTLAGELRVPRTAASAPVWAALMRGMNCSLRERLFKGKK